MIYFAVLLIIIFLLGCLSIYFFSYEFASLSIFTNLIISVLAAYITNVFLNKFYKKSDFKFILLPFFLSFFVPILGVIISFFIVMAIYRINNKFYRFTKELYDPINLQHVKYTSEEYGAGGAFLNLMKTHENPVKRIRALFILAQGQLANINNILQDLLPDSSDEIRLLSFNILDQQEGFIEKDINKILSTMETTNPDNLQRAKYEKNLAQLYWELTYRHLVLKELEEGTLKKALSYVQSAILVLHDDPVAWVLLGKIYYKLNELQLAEEALQKASALNLPPSQVLPYLAEIKFKFKDYAEVRFYLGESDSLYDINRIASVKRYWEKT